MSFMRDPSTQPAASPATKLDPNKLMKDMTESKTILKISNAKGPVGTKSLKTIIDEAKSANKTVVLTVTPGPFKDAKELPPSWMKTDEAVGCSHQLNAMNGEAATLNADIYAINKQSSDYQCGAGTNDSTSLLNVKKWDKLFMISDENGDLQRELGLPTIIVDTKQYLARLTVAIKPDGSKQLFELSSPVNPTKAADHVAAIKQFITPVVANTATVAATASSTM